MGMRAGMGSFLNKESLLVNSAALFWGEPEKFYCEEGQKEGKRGYKGSYESTEGVGYQAAKARCSQPFALLR
jgi:hypothetical protein